MPAKWLPGLALLALAASGLRPTPPPRRLTRRPATAAQPPPPPPPGTAQVLLVVPDGTTASPFGATSPQPSPSWLRVATHLAQRLRYFDPRLSAAAVTLEQVTWSQRDRGRAIVRLRDCGLADFELANSRRCRSPLRAGHSGARGESGPGAGARAADREFTPRGALGGRAGGAAAAATGQRGARGLRGRRCLRLRGLPVRRAVGAAAVRWGVHGCQSWWATRRQRRWRG